VILATDDQIRQAQALLDSLSDQDQSPASRSAVFGAKAVLLTLIIVIFYGISVWALTLPLVDPIIFIPAFTIAIICSLLLGKALSRE
jgi:prepilin signal peptidase PulO-like enzyme (type II secretory pathway)